MTRLTLVAQLREKVAKVIKTPWKRGRLVEAMAADRASGISVAHQPHRHPRCVR